MSASQKSGVAKPTNTKIVVILSNFEYWRVAENTPIGIARATMIIISTTLRSSVTGRRSPIFCSTGRASGENDRPKSSWTSRVSQFQYWTWSGLSSPYIWMSRSRTSLSDWIGVSPVPSSVGSPGARWITENEMRRGMARTSRRSAYPSMARYSSVTRTISTSTPPCNAAAASARTTR